MKPQHTPEQLERALGRYDLGIRWNLSGEEVQSILHYLSEYRRLADGKPLLADGTVAMEGEIVWCRGRQYVVDEDVEDCACAADDEHTNYLVLLSECYRTREASMEAEQCK